MLSCGVRSIRREGIARFDGVSSPEVLAEVEHALSQHFGHQPQRADVSFLGVEPISILRFASASGELTYVSLGMSRRPMTPAAEGMLDPEGPRAELALRVLESAGGFQDVWRQLAVLAAAPVVEGVVYRAEMSIDLGQPLATQSRCTGVIVDGAATIEVESTVGVVEVLGLSAATPNELAWARVHGVAALRARWATNATELSDLGRASVDLG